MSEVKLKRMGLHYKLSSFQYQMRVDLNNDRVHLVSFYDNISAKDVAEKLIKMGETILRDIKAG